MQLDHANANDAVRMRVRTLLRAHWRSVILLGVMAGFAAAVPMTAWAVARRTDRALPMFLDQAATPDVAVLTCPPGFVLPDEASMSEEERQTAFAPCSNYDATAELGDLVALPEIERAAVVSFVVGELTFAAGGTERVGFSVGHDPDAPLAYGTGLLIAGRAADPHAPDEFTVGELTAGILPEGIGVGSKMIFTPLLASQPECASGQDCLPGGAPVELQLVGIVRTPTDLASTSGSDGGFYVSPGFWTAHGGPELFSYGTGAKLWAADGFHAEDVTAAVQRRWPGRPVQFESGNPPQVLRLPDAIRYQALAAAALAAATALVAIVFLGQALARQARRECRDLPTCSALGMTRREAVTAAALRGLPEAAIGAVLGVATTVVLSPVGPIGIARSTQASPSIESDGAVLVVGGIVVFVVVVVSSTIPALRAPLSLLPDRRSGRSGPAIADQRRGLVHLGAPGLLGTRAAIPRRRTGAVPLTTAVMGCAFVVATVIIAATVTTSLDDLLAQPVRYGVAWDVLVGNIGSRDDEAASFAKVAAVPGIDAAAGIMSEPAFSGDVALPVVAMVPIAGLGRLDPVIVDGRRPVGPDEIALGGTTMRELGVGVGDEMTFSFEQSPGDELTATVVGRAIVNDGSDIEAGTGGVVDSTWERSLVPSSQPQNIALQLDPSDDRESTISTLQEKFSNDFVVTPSPSYGIRNLARVDRAPWLLAIVMAILAVGALAHALVLSVRARRVELSVLKALGFTRRQVLTSVAWQASTVAMLALVIGIPVGVVGGRQAWSVIARRVGVAETSAHTTLAIAACSLGLLMITNLVAAVPGHAAASVRPAEVLRTG